MNNLWGTFSEAIAALLSGDPQLWSIVGVSFGVSASALLIALLPALTLGFRFGLLSISWSLGGHQCGQ